MSRPDALLPRAPSPRQKIGCWNDIGPETFALPERKCKSMIDFTGHLSRPGKGRVRVAEICSDAQVVRHSREHV
ncbi:MAG TPA: hypothetical protein VE175_06815, partial [Woeseiaceae bacterium]|nr:hypothetical protein [Woeseiaceae bacterium]